MTISGEQILKLVSNRVKAVRARNRAIEEQRQIINQLKEHLAGPVSPDLRREVTDAIDDFENGTETVESIQEAYDGNFQRILEDLGGSFVDAHAVHSAVGKNIGITVTEPDQFNEIEEIREGYWYDSVTGQWVGDVDYLKERYPKQEQDPENN